MAQKSVTTYYLEMHDPSDLRAAARPHGEVDVLRVLPPCPELNRFFYTAVGGDWYWNDRLPWTYRQWLDYLKRPELETWMFTVNQLPAGYFELEQQGIETGDIDVEIAYFGLLPHFLGKGLGGYLLTQAIERAWEIEATRVWVHTCTLDHPKALANYQARGMRIYKEETAVEEVAPEPIGPWPGAIPL
jgi:GNAT superfamily N-acetyltransferase